MYSDLLFLSAAPANKTISIPLTSKIKTGKMTMRYSAGSKMFVGFDQFRLLEFGKNNKIFFSAVLRVNLPRKIF